MFYDLHVHVGDVKEVIKIARKLGFSGFCATMTWKTSRDLVDFQKSIKKIKGFDIAIGVEIKTKSTSLVKKVSRTLRKDVEIVFVHGGDLEVNRAALETAQVDVLLTPWSERRDSGLNHVLVKLAKKNNVAICFDFSELVVSHKKTRSHLLSHMQEAAKLVRKYKSPFILSSGALSAWDLRSSSELIAFGKVLGFQDPEIKKALSGNIVSENRKRLSGKWVMPGVEIE